MQIIELNINAPFDQDKKLQSQVAHFDKLIQELKKREIPADEVNSINEIVEVINIQKGSSKELRKLLSKSHHKILRRIEAKLKLVPRNHFRSRWMAIGLSAFGVPIGVSFGVSMNNMSYLGIGIPIGMVIGMAIGSAMDKKAREEGRQLDL